MYYQVTHRCTTTSIGPTTRLEVSNHQLTLKMLFANTMEKERYSTYSHHNFFRFDSCFVLGPGLISLDILAQKIAIYRKLPYVCFVPRLGCQSSSPGLCGQWDWPLRVVGVVRGVGDTSLCVRMDQWMSVEGNGPPVDNGRRGHGSWTLVGFCWTFWHMGNITFSSFLLGGLHYGGSMSPPGWRKRFDGPVAGAKWYTVSTYFLLQTPDPININIESTLRATNWTSLSGSL